MSIFFSPEDSQPANLANLRRLFWLRNFAITGQIGVVLTAIWLFDMQIPQSAVFAVIGFLLCFNLYTWLRLRSGRDVSQREFFYHLLIDIAALSVLLALTGGATNPFIFLYLIPLTIAATVLTSLYTWLLAAITVACYSALMLSFNSMEHAGHGMHNFNLHIFGMWFGFVLSAGLIAYFVVSMRNSLRKQQNELSDAREREIKNDKLVALGTLAASTAHELGTPLGTISLLASELEDDEQLNAESRESVRDLKAQVVRCKEALSVLSASAGGVHMSSGGSMAIDQYLQQLLQSWQQTRPQATVVTTWQGTQPAPNILAEKTLSQAITNILDNAADVSPKAIDWHASWTQDSLTMEVHDRGPGLSAALKHQLGKQPVESQSQGMGLGLFLAHSIIDRFGGKVTMLERKQGGLGTRIQLPLQVMNP